MNDYRDFDDSHLHGSGPLHPPQEVAYDDGDKDYGRENNNREQLQRPCGQFGDEHEPTEEQVQAVKNIARFGGGWWMKRDRVIFAPNLPPELLP